MAIAETPSTACVFYDITMRPPVKETCCSPNPWKSRYALNFKGIPYSTTWVDMPDIPKVRRELGVPATRKFADGTDFFTLPILSDPTTGSTLGDSFDIAVYLQKNYPNSGAGDLLPPQKLDYVYTPDTPSLIPLSERNEQGYGDYARFNVNIDAVFTAHVPLMGYFLPFPPESAEASRAIFIQRAGGGSWDDFKVSGVAREEMMRSFHDALGELSKLFTSDKSGPFLLGEKASYADFIVGGWVKMASRTLPEAEWQEMRAWHGGTFGRLYDALEKYAQVD